MGAVFTFSYVHFFWGVSCVCALYTHTYPYTGKDIWNHRASAEAPILWLPDAKSRLAAKDPDAEKD